MILPLKIGGETETFSDKQKLKKFVVSRSVLEKNLKNPLERRKKKYRSQTHICVKKGKLSAKEQVKVSLKSGGLDSKSPVCGSSGYCHLFFLLIIDITGYTFLKVLILKNAFNCLCIYVYNYTLYNIYIYMLMSKCNEI